MCNRYSQTKDRIKLESRFARIIIFEALQRYNIAPTQTAPVAVISGGEASVQELRWGFSGHTGPVMNARSETAHEKKLFRDAWKQGHCLVAADGFYDWRTMPDGMQPYYYTLPTHDSFWFAALRDGDRYTILTAPPSGFIATMHNRMPLILKPDALDGWLSQKPWSVEELWAHCHGGTELHHWPVTRQMSHARHTHPTASTDRHSPAGIRLQLNWFANHYSHG